ncbi:unnamed protein product [Brachionus calyciflorus]|uniref:Uncharacterized protein n=1 Tax=Brachionus calyciflorus TaxID=104777 RepID=A0A814P6U3_9BILA|nr:unnamed protein product [Brachionus calyciflorus]
MLAKVDKIEEFFENIQRIYDVLEIQGLLLSNLSHETQKKVRQLERFYKHKEIVQRVYLNNEDEIPSYQIPI